MELPYQNQFCFVATMHEKERAISSSFEQFLGCKVVQARIDTDLLGTFTGEIERKLSPLECVKEKCYRGLDSKNGTLGVANEGSFGPHPVIPFVSADREFLFFADRNLGFELTLSKISLNTNFASTTVSNIEELATFAQRALFPSHGLILRPNMRKDETLIYKEIQTFQELYAAFRACYSLSSDSKVWVETDMRAYRNPTRMKVIGDLALVMAIRLAKRCPCCQIPGWGIVKKLSGLPCESCGAPTGLIQSEVYGCCKCSHQETVPLPQQIADPGYCQFCNP